MISFSIEPRAEPIGDAIELLYDESGRSFVTTGARPQTWHSVLVNDLELHVDPDGLVVSVDGYAPRESWAASDAEPPHAVDGLVRTPPRPDVPRGSSVRLTRTPDELPSFFNRGVGWLCVGDTGASGVGGSAVRMNPGTILVISGDQLVAIWLQVRAPAATP